MNKFTKNVWHEAAINTETVMVHIRNLREKIEINPSNPTIPKSSLGALGYKNRKNKQTMNKKKIIFYIITVSLLLISSIGIYCSYDIMQSEKKKPNLVTIIFYMMF